MNNSMSVSMNTSTYHKYQMVFKWQKVLFNCFINSVRLLSLLLSNSLLSVC